MKLAIAFMIPLGVYAQIRDNAERELSCQAGSFSGQVHRCGIREESFAALGRIKADPGRNGSVTVRGWSRDDVLLRSRVDVWADTDAEAAALLTQIRIDTSNGAISASGPAITGRRGWTVSSEIFVPRLTDLDIRAFNGGITVSDVEGTIQVETKNGGISLSRLAGHVMGQTTNGGINLELADSTWRGPKIELVTENGGVTMSVPESYSAHIQAGTANGRMLSEFPMAISGGISSQSVDADLGAGGPLVRVSSVNGGVILRRAQSVN